MYHSLDPCNFKCKQQKNTISKHHLHANTCRIVSKIASISYNCLIRTSMSSRITSISGFSFSSNLFFTDAKSCEQVSIYRSLFSFSYTLERTRSNVVAEFGLKSALQEAAIVYSKEQGKPKAAGIFESFLKFLKDVPCLATTIYT